MKTVDSSSGATVEPKSGAVLPLDADFGSRLRQFVLAQLTQAQRLLARPGDKRHRGVHEGRKCLRRARATLALAAKALGPRAKGLDDALGQLCRGLSALRDAQALTEALRRLQKEAVLRPEINIDTALILARARRDEVMARALVRDPNLAKRRQRLKRLSARLAALDWSGVTARGVAKAVKRSERRVERAEQRARRHSDDDEVWHSLRRRIRRLRQQHSALHEVAPGWLAPMAAEFEQQAVVLGHAQDDALLLAHCGRGSVFPLPLRRALREIARQRLQTSRDSRSEVVS